MQRFIFINLLLILTIHITLSQSSTISLKYTAVDSISHVQLDKIKVINLTQGCDTILYWPDTALSISFVDIIETTKTKDEFRFIQNTPNFEGNYIKISLYVPEADRVRLILTDLNGRVSRLFYDVIDEGINVFSITPGYNKLPIITAEWRKNIISIKLLGIFTNQSGAARVDFLERVTLSKTLKFETQEQCFSYNLGDELLFVGYIDTLESGIHDKPENDSLYTFQFATNIPCLEAPTVSYEGRIYSTIQIFSQCWFKENLQAGIMIDSLADMTDNGIIEKYCYRNSEDSCEIYGGLYQWEELMDYCEIEGSQGICPEGWHVPTNLEWTILEGAADSYFGIGDSIWYIEIQEYRGYDVSPNLRSTYNWIENENGYDLFGFTVLPSGIRNESPFGHFEGISMVAQLWTSSTYGSWWSADNRKINYIYDGIMRGLSDWFKGKSVRCLKD
jgi:uncharacterized protein (TIGR02145 family)